MKISDNPVPLSINTLFKKAAQGHNKIVLLKQQQQKSQSKKVYPTEFIFAILSKPKIERTKADIRILSDYLSNKYDYFKKLRESSEITKLERLVSVLNLEIFNENEPIIRFGEEGDKFYILLDGRVNLYKTVYPEKVITIKEYLQYLNYVLHVEKNDLKYQRIIEKNAFLKLDMNFLMSIPPESFHNKQQMKCFIEEEEKLCDFGDGFAFGEVALLKKTKRNATIKAFTKCKLVSIEKADYNKIIRELEEKRLEKELKSFKISFPLFELWSLNHLIRLFNFITTRTLTKGEYLYKQNEESDYIYFVENGTFDIFSLVSMGWIEGFYRYIVHSKSNLVHFLKKKLKERELLEVFEDAKKIALSSPVEYDPLKVAKIITSLRRDDNLIELEKEKEEFNDPYNLFKVNIRKLEEKDVLGFEDSLEMKRRFCFVKCTSPSAQVKQIKLIDFFRLVNYSPEEKIKDVLMSVIAEKKSALYRQIKKGVLQKKKEFDFIINGKVQDCLGTGTEDMTTTTGNSSYRTGANASSRKQPNISNSFRSFRVLKKSYSTLMLEKKDDKVLLKLPISPVKPKKDLNIDTGLTSNDNISMEMLNSGKEYMNFKSPSTSLNSGGMVVPSTLSGTPFNLKISGDSFARHSPRILNQTSNFIQFYKNNPNVRAFRREIGFNSSCSGELPSIGKFTPNTQADRSKSFLSRGGQREKYVKKIGDSYSALTHEILKLTGVQKIVPKKEITFNVYDDTDESAMIIQSFQNKGRKDSSNLRVTDYDVFSHKKTRNLMRRSFNRNKKMLSFHPISKKSFRKESQ